MTSRVLIWLAIGLTFAMGACGDEGPGPEAETGNREAMPGSVSRDETVSSSGAAVNAPGTTKHDPAGVLEGRRAVPTEGGGVYYAPIKPRVEIVAPSKACTYSSDESHPPRPGLQAVRSGSNRFRVRVILEPAPGECAPKFIRMAFDVNDDSLPPSSPLAGPLIPTKRFTPWLEVSVPDRAKDADVLNAISVMGDGRSSDTASVLIGDGG